MIYIGTDEGIYRWFGGAPWPVYHGLQDRAIVSMTAPGAGLLAAVDGGGQVWETENNGLDWSEVPVPDWAGRPAALAMAGGGTAFLLATRPMGLYRRTVGAPIPKRPGEESGPAFLRGLMRQVSGATAVLAKPSKAVADPGWAKLATPTGSTPGASNSIRVLTSRAGESGVTWFAAVSGAGLWKSQDGGMTWELCPGLPNEIYAIRVASKGTGSVILATADGCRVSTDGGRTWEDRSGGLDQARHLRAVEVHPDEPNTMFAGASPTVTPDAPRRGTRFALYETTDGGQTWMHARRGFPDELEYDTISDIRFDPAAPENAIVALDSGELWRTRNGGDWWEPIARQIRAARVLCAVG